MLKRLSLFRVVVCMLTTPSIAYEAQDTIKLNLISDLELKKQSLDLKTNVSLIPQTQAAPKNEELCAATVAEAETVYGIKKNLLSTIASVESGRWSASANKRVAWPWTVHANGKGYYYNSKAEAVLAVQTLQNQGITNIDVGCMQINLKYHGKAFKNLEEAFDPKANAAYSASFLKKLYSRTKSWQKTAMHYHSKVASKGLNYKNRLEKHYAEFITQRPNQTLF